MSKLERNRVSMNGKEVHEIIEWEGMKARCLAYIMFNHQYLTTLGSRIYKHQPRETAGTSVV